MRMKLACDVEIDISSMYEGIYDSVEKAKVTLNFYGRATAQLEFFLFASECDKISEELNRYGTYKQGPTEEQTQIRKLLTDENYAGKNNLEKINTLITINKNIVAREKRSYEDLRKLQKEKSELENKEKRLRHLLDQCGEIIEGTDLSKLTIEEALKRLLDDRRRAQLALAGVFEG